VAEHDAQVAGTNGAGSLHKFLLAGGEHLPAGEARHGFPRSNANANKDEQHAAQPGIQLAHGIRERSRVRLGKGGAEERQHEDDEQELREGIEDVHNAHHDVIHPPAKEAGDGAINHANNQADDGSNECHGQGNAGAVHDAAEEITTGIIRTQRVIIVDLGIGAHGGKDLQHPFRGAVVGNQVLLGIVHNRNLVCKNCHQDQDDNDAPANHRGAVAEEPPEGIPPKAFAFLGQWNTARTCPNIF